MKMAYATEVVGTYFLVLTVGLTSLSQTPFAPLAIGFTIVVAAFAGGGISGGAFNPAVGVGPALIDTLMGHGTLANVWLYVVGPIAGGAIAALFFRAQNPEPESGSAIPSAAPGEERVVAGEYTAPRPGRGDAR